MHAARASQPNAAAAGARTVAPRTCARFVPFAAASHGAPAGRLQDDLQRAAAQLDRRTLLGAAAGMAAAAAWQPPASAVQGLTAGRIPGVTGPDPDGYMTYTRPEGKSGGHGVGWTEIQRYSFKVPQSWEETPVSIADLGGTEIDLRYGNREEGNLLVVVAPVLRFKEIPIGANVNVTDLAPPENIIAGFAPELFGVPLQEGDLLDMQVVTKDGLPYYVYELSKHRLVSAAATGNRLYMLALRCNSIQWRRAGDKAVKIRDSFRVPPKAEA